MQKRIRFTAILVIAAVLIIAAIILIARKSGSSPVSLRTASVKRGDVVATISATGTVEPEEVVDVGAQVAGIVEAFGKDINGKTVDYGSEVDVGTILARIDDSLYAATLAQSRAQLQLDQAAVPQAQANNLQSVAKLSDAQRDWERAQKLGPSDALASTSYDAYKATYEVAKATVAASEAAVDQAKAKVLLSKAALEWAQRNLNYCTITAPVKGVIIDRRVNIGQTVVASLNTPSLFLIAKDLRRIQVWVSVNEADIGNIRVGQPVTFTVDAFPGRIFRGQVGQTRLNATMTQNVVTYTVAVNTDNSDGRLLPYLTASAKFETGRRQNVFTIPNSALRWWPRTEQVVPSFRKEMTVAPQPSRPITAAGGVQARPEQAGVVWVKQGDSVRPQNVSVGLTDGVITEISSPALKEGLELVIGEQAAGTAANPNSNRSPFAPQLRSPQRGPTTGQPPAKQKP
ncbi:MAG: efflux RND transporter periplasmic adaptor subunit [Candidatus Aminicenantales bacterium]